MTGFQQAAAVLFKEAFEGIPPGADGTWFVQGKEGIFDALTSISAESASYKPLPDCPSIAAHAYHLLYALRWANTSQGRPAPEGTWESSWAKQSATDAEWGELIQTIKSEYELYFGWLKCNDDWSGEDAYIGGLGIVPHVAYHLGAIRQLLYIVNH